MLFALMSTFRHASSCLIKSCSPSITSIFLTYLLITCFCDTGLPCCIIFLIYETWTAKHSWLKAVCSKFFQLQFFGNCLISPMLKKRFCSNGIWGLQLNSLGSWMSPALFIEGHLLMWLLRPALRPGLSQGDVSFVLCHIWNLICTGVL